MKNDADPNPLTTLLRGCVVRIDAAGHFCGTGFFVSPGRVVTCAHVVRGEMDLRVTWQRRPSCSVTSVLAEPPFDDVAANGPYPPPDLAVIDLDASAATWDHPCVHLATDRPVLDGRGNVLYLAGYTDEYRTNVRELTGITTSFESEYNFESESESEFGVGTHILYKLKEGQVRPGYSGSPLLDLRTGAVTGIMKASRDKNTALGGFAVPAIELTAPPFKDLLVANAEFHRSDSRWKNALEQHRIHPLNPTRLGLDPKPKRPGPDGEVSPTTLFSPQSAIVGYVGRRGLLDGLAGWRDDLTTDSEPVALRFVMATGGYGKTRLAIEACAEAESVGWTAGLLQPGLTDDQIRELAEWPGRLLLVVDDAETRPRRVARLVREFVIQAARPPVRIVLLVRRHAVRERLLTQFNEEHDASLRALLFSAPVCHLDEPSAEVDRLDLFHRAYVDFARRTGLDSKGDGSPLPSLRAPHFARPLYVLMAAYLYLNRQHTHTNVNSFGEIGLLRFLLEEYEAQYWERIAKRRVVPIETVDQWNAVALATLLTAQGDEEALALVRLVPHYRDETEPTLMAVARWLGELYAEPPAANRELRIAPLEPDRLGEFLVAELLNRYPDLLVAALDTVSDRQLAHALAIVANAAVDYPAVKTLLSRALDERLVDLFLRGLGAGPQPQGIDPELFNAVVIAMLVSEPVAGTIAFAKTLNLALPSWLQDHCIGAAELAVTGLRELISSDPAKEPELVTILSRLSVRLRMTGRREEAAERAREAVSRCRALTADHPGEFQSTLTFAMLSLVEAEQKLGGGAETKALAEETVALGRTLVATDRAEGLPYLAASLRHATGLAAAQEAVSIDRELAADDPLNHLPSLAQSLAALATTAHNSGQPSSAADAATEAIEIFRKVAGSRGDAYLPELAESLAILARARLAIEPPDQVLPIASEAVAISRQLAGDMEKDVPQGYLATLESSLRTAAAVLSEAGKLGDALGSWQEATDICQRLARENPGAYRPGLAAALTGLGTARWDVGQMEGGLSATSEAVSIHRSIAETDPDEYRLARVQSLTNLAAYLANMLIDDEALPVAHEALQEYRQLAEAGTDVTSPMATALTNLAVLLSRAGDTEEAIRTVTEATSLYAGRTDSIPVTDVASYAASLQTLAEVLRDAGRLAEAVDRARQAVDLQREAAGHSPRELLALAHALQTMAACLESAGLVKDSLPARREAISIYRELATATPRPYARNLGDADGTLAALLDDAGRRNDADQIFAEHIAIFAEVPDGLGPILLARGRQQSARGDLPAAIADLDAAARIATGAEDYPTHGRVRRYLRDLRARDSSAFDRAWGERHGPLPVWLSYLTPDDQLAGRVSVWSRVTVIGESQSYLEDHADLLFTDQAESALEHLIDINPEAGILRSRLEMLQAARARGVGNAYRALAEDVLEREAAHLLHAWLSCGSWQVGLGFAVVHARDLVGPASVACFDRACTQHPEMRSFRLHRGVLHYAAEAPDAADGFRDAYDLGLDAGRLRSALTVSDPPLPASTRLAVARMYSGQHRNRPEAHFLLGIILLGEQDLGDEQIAEAKVVLADCADDAAPYERRDFARRLSEFVAQHPALTAYDDELQDLLIKRP